MSPHQQTVGIDAVRGTGHQSAVILPQLYFQFLHFMGLHRQNLVHLIRHSLSQNVEIKHIVQFYTFQFRKQSGAWKAPVAGYNRMASHTAHRQGASFNMAYALLQHGFAGSVVDGQKRIDAGNLNIAHGSLDIDAELFFIDLPLFICEGPALGFFLGQSFVIRLGVLPQGFSGFLIHGLCLLHIAYHCLGLVISVPQTAYSGIEEQNHADQKEKGQQPHDNPPPQEKLCRSGRLFFRPCRVSSSFLPLISGHNLSSCGSCGKGQFLLPQSK